MEEPRVSIGESTLNKVLGILGQMPYTQVAALINEIQTDARMIDNTAKSELRAVAEGEKS